MSGMGDPAAMAALLRQLEDTLADVRLSDDERRELGHALREASPPEEGLRQLRNRAFELVRSRTDDPEQQALLRWLEGVVRSIDMGRQPADLVHSRAFFSPGDACLRTIVQQLRDARERADLCVFTLSDDRIAREVFAAHQRGVAVRLISDDDKAHDEGSDVFAMQAAGIAVRLDRTAAHMHHKFALIDGTWLLNGSYNWTRSACLVNDENLVLSNDPALVMRFSQVFEDMWRALG